MKFTKTRWFTSNPTPNMDTISNIYMYIYIFLQPSGYRFLGVVDLANKNGTIWVLRVFIYIHMDFDLSICICVHVFLILSTQTCCRRSSRTLQSWQAVFVLFATMSMWRICHGDWFLTSVVLLMLPLVNYLFQQEYPHFQLVWRNRHRQQCIIYIYTYILHPKTYGEQMF